MIRQVPFEHSANDADPFCNFVFHLARPIVKCWILGAGLFGFVATRFVLQSRAVYTAAMNDLFIFTPTHIRAQTETDRERHCTVCYHTAL